MDYSILCLEPTLLYIELPQVIIVRLSQYKNKMKQENFKYINTKDIKL